MKKFKVVVSCDYVTGYLKYGHGEVVIEAENEEQAIEQGKKLAKSRDLDIYVDVYSLEDYEYDLDNIEVTEVPNE